MDERDAAFLLDLFPKPMIKSVLELRQALENNKPIWTTTKTDEKVKFELEWVLPATVKNKSYEEADSDYTPVKNKRIKLEPKCEPATLEGKTTVASMESSKDTTVKTKSENQVENESNSAAARDDNYENNKVASHKVLSGANECTKIRNTSRTAAVAVSTSSAAVATVAPLIVAKIPTDAAKTNSTVANSSQNSNRKRQRVTWYYNSYDYLIENYWNYNEANLYISLDQTIYHLYDGGVAIYGDVLGGDDYCDKRYGIAAYFYLSSPYSTDCQVIPLSDYCSYINLDDLVNNPSCIFEAGEGVRHYPSFRAAEVECEKLNRWMTDSLFLY